MAKVTAPFLSLTASGTLGKTLTASRWKGVVYMRTRVIPKLSTEATSVAVRAVIKDASEAWKSNATVGSTVIDATYKSAFDAVAEGQAFSGFNLYMKNCVAINYDKDTSPYYDGTLVIPTDPTDIGA
jgi:hypothetical protein